MKTISFKLKPKIRFVYLTKRGLWDVFDRDMYIWKKNDKKLKNQFFFE